MNMREVLGNHHRDARTHFLAAQEGRPGWQSHIDERLWAERGGRGWSRLEIAAFYRGLSEGLRLAIDGLTAE